MSRTIEDIRESHYKRRDQLLKTERSEECMNCDERWPQSLMQTHTVYPWPGCKSSVTVCPLCEW